MFGPPCSLNDSIECCGCKTVLKIWEHTVVHGEWIPKDSEPGQFWIPKFYYCPCDLEYPHAYDPGDGKLVHIENAASELIKEFKWRVMWSRPKRRGVPESVAGEFTAMRKAYAWVIFERDFKNQQMYCGDKLVLLRIVVEEQSEVIATVEAKEITEDE